MNGYVDAEIGVKILRTKLEIYSFTKYNITMHNLGKETNNAIIIFTVLILSEYSCTS
jgi:hypothetical protein